ncbi:DUF4265 domain-containing protein [Neisseria sp.]|uniref:DUF4265 domain-containing protein n=1 Tax=Neisseria sp. TaxID=192066 RepID=UPI0035A0DD18
MKKIFFKLIIEDGYPPASEESIWGIELADNLFKIDNIPFYTDDVSYEDTVSVKEENGHLYYKKTVQSSGNSTIRIIFFDEEKVDECLARLEQIGCEYERFSSVFIAINIPITLNIETVLTYLQYLSAQETADYEYGKIAQYAY